MKTIRFETAAARSFRKLPVDAQAALRATVEAFASRTGSGRPKRLQGREGVRLRAGDYRLVLEETAAEIVIVAAGHRRDIYR